MRITFVIIIAAAAAIAVAGASIAAVYLARPYGPPNPALQDSQRNPPENGNSSASAGPSGKVLSVFTSTRDTATIGLIEKYVGPGDDVIGPGSPLARDIPSAKKIAPTPSLDGIATAMSDARSRGIKLDYIVYDPEHWPQTPQQEQQDIAGSVSKAADAVHGAGLKFGVTPDRTYLIDNYQGIDWRKVDYLNMQFQRELADRANFTLFAGDVKKVTEFARAENPNIEVFVQMSFRFTDPQDIIKAVDMSSGYVDGFVFVYLPNGPCQYCSNENLETVLAHVHPLGRQV